MPVELYAKFELLLCVGEQQNGPSIPIINELATQYPTVDIKIFQGAHNFELVLLILHAISSHTIDIEIFLGI